MLLKDRIIALVDEARQSMNSLQSSDFGRAYFWQIVKSHADKASEDAWKELQDPAGKVKLPDDDALRKVGVGENVIRSTKLFSVTAAVARPGESLDSEAFVIELLEKFPQFRTKITNIVNRHTKTHKARLTKRIVEKVEV